MKKVTSLGKWKRNKKSDILYHFCDIPSCDLRMIIYLIQREGCWTQGSEVRVGSNLIYDAKIDVINESIEEFEARNLDGLKWNLINQAIDYFNRSSRALWEFNNN